MGDENTVRTMVELGAAVRVFLEQLPQRLGRRAVVLVPGEALAHELRRMLMDASDGPALLCGVHFTRAETLALELCVRAPTRRRFRSSGSRPSPSPAGP